MPNPLAIEILRPGRFRALGGQDVEFSDADLVQLAASYDPAVHEAPIVLGHPKNDDPAFGWVRGLRVADGRLQADTDQLDPEFAEGVRDGRYKKVSAAVYHPKSVGNPKPGSYYLKHVGFLGATVPAVKGLRQVQLAGDDDAVIVELGEYEDHRLARVLRSLRDWLIGKHGKEEADLAMPPWDVDMVQEGAALPASLAEPAEPAEPAAPATPAEPAPAPAPASVDAPEPVSLAAAPDQAERDARDLELAERERKLAERELQFAESSRAAQHADDRAFLDGLVADGRPLPCARDTLLVLMARLRGDDTLSFAEGESREPISILREEVLARLPRTIELSEVAGPEAELEQSDLVQRTIEYQAAARGRGEYLTTAEAMAHVRRGANHR